jgi:hypothetical protein
VSGCAAWLDVTLIVTDGGTTLELSHEAPVDPERWEQFGPGAVGVGWDLGLMGLGLYVESATSVDHQVAVEFTSTPDGIEFVQRAAAAWGRRRGR